MQKEVEEYQRRIADGTPVTRESFLAWRAKFLAEHPELPQLDVEDNKGKMTGTLIICLSPTPQFSQMMICRQEDIRNNVSKCHYRTCRERYA